jgi:Tfp pilus assembly protein PilN
MMYTIDLLKGRGIPIRNRRGGLLIIAITIAVPLIIAMMMYTNYLMTKIATNRTEISIADRDTQIKKMADAVKNVESLENENAVLNNCLGDVATAIQQKIQWSPIIHVLAKEMPSSVVLNKLDVGLVTQTKQVPDKRDKTKLINVPQNLRTLRMSLLDYGRSDNGEKVQRFIDVLKKSDVLESKVENIRIAAQERDKENSEVIRYDIECVFKPQG